MIPAAPNKAVTPGSVTGPVRLLSFKRSRSDWRYRPTTGWSSFQGHVSVITGGLVEPDGCGGWRPVEHPPDIDLQAVLAFVAQESNQGGSS